MEPHPIRLVVEDDLDRSRLTVFFRLLLALPHFFWIALWSLLVLVLAFVAWLVGIVRGRIPDGLHNLFMLYVRYAIQLGAYVGLAANPYPGFTGSDRYPVDVVLPRHAEPQPRWRIALRLPLALPALLLAAALGSGAGGGAAGRESEGGWVVSSGVGGVAALCAFLGWFAILARGRMPIGLRNLGAYGLGYTAQAYAYGLLLTDRYPNSDPDALGPAWELPPHPVRIAVDDDRRRSRLTVFFRVLLALPHLVWLVLWTVAASLAALANGIVALVRGRSADSLHRFLAAYVRYAAHVTAFTALVANPFPGFTGTPGYPVDVEVEPLEPQHRLVTLFRVVLAVPAFLLSGGLSGVLFVVGVLGWFAALATGRMPEGLRNLGAVCVRYLAQTNAYWFIVTDAYPHASPALAPPPAAEPEPVH